MQFLYPQLAWGLALVGVPALIHLINMLRHRRQKWAAMDFLLESHRKNRRWVMLKQWLLLAARMLAMLLLVLMLAKWVSSSQWLSSFGGQTTHHYILLDDSYSMAEVEGGETAYKRGLAALGGLVRSIAGQPGDHQLTLLRYSRAWLVSGQQSQLARLDAAADLNAQSVPQDPERLLDRINASSPTGLALSPEVAIDLLAPMIAQGTEQKPRVYLLTDLRRNEFGEPEALRNKLQTLADQSAEFTVVDCGKSSQANLTVVSAEPEKEVWAAGVPLMVRFQIRNQSEAPVRNVVANVRAISYAQGVVKVAPELPYSGDVVELPPVVIEQIAAGATVTRQVQVIFSSAGSHVVEIKLPEDALASDNQRWCVIDIQQTQRVMLVDGEASGENAFFYQTAVNPDQRLNTGVTIELADSAYLRDIDPVALEQYDVVGLLDVPRLDPQAVSKLEEFCRRGRGVFFVGGRNTNLQNVNEQFYRDGNGLFPLELQGINEFSALGGEPQVTIDEHPIFLPLVPLANSPFFSLRIQKMFSVDQEQLSERGVEVVAYGPERRPLILDMPFGEGRVVAVLTGLTGQWSNWTQDPTFVVLALRSLGYLGSFRREATSFPVGSPLDVVALDKSMLPEGELLMPSRSVGPRLRLQTPVEQVEEPDSLRSVARMEVAVNLGETDRDVIDRLLDAGVFEAWMTDTGGLEYVENRAHNVAASEGNLDRVERSELSSKFPGLPLEVRAADEVSGSGLNSQEASQSTLMMVLLAALLIGEQLLAYSASYHAPRLAGSKT